MADPNLSKTNIAKPVSQLPTIDNEFLLEFRNWLEKYQAPVQSQKNERTWETFNELIAKWDNEMQGWNIHKLKRYLDFIEVVDGKGVTGKGLEVVNEHQKQLITSEKSVLPLIIKRLGEEMPKKGEPKKVSLRYKSIKEYLESFLRRTDLRLSQIQTGLDKLSPRKTDLDKIFNSAKDIDKLPFELIQERRNLNRIYNNLQTSKELYTNYHEQLAKYYHKIEEILKT